MKQISLERAVNSFFGTLMLGASFILAVPAILNYFNNKEIGVFAPLYLTSAYILNKGINMIQDANTNSQ